MRRNDGRLRNDGRFQAKRNLDAELVTSVNQADERAAQLDHGPSRDPNRWCVSHRCTMPCCVASLRRAHM
jgi:hypothetical protein